MDDGNGVELRKQLGNNGKIFQGSFLVAQEERDKKQFGILTKMVIIANIKLWRHCQIQKRPSMLLMIKMTS